MDFALFRNEIKSEVFDYQILLKYLSDLKKPRDKIFSLLSEGKIVRLKKGLYVFGESWRKHPLSLEVIANLIYGPSCLSFEYALTLYGMIAERSVVVTSLTIGDSKEFKTPIGLFEYRAINKEKFKVGIEYRDLQEEGGYLIACKEKAIVDLVYRTPGIRSIENLRHFLFEEMRVNKEMFYQLNRDTFRKLAQVYKKNSVTMLEKL